MKIISITFGTLLASTLIGTTFASHNYYSNTTVCTLDAYVCPNGQSVGRTGSNCQFVCPTTPSIPTTMVKSSYFYTSGCYTYYYNGTTNKTSILSNQCLTNYNNNYNNYTANYDIYSYPNVSYYYTAPSTYYTNTSPYTSAYYYQNTQTDPTYSYPTYYTNYNSGYNTSYNNYNVGYTDTGYANYYTQPSSCYWQNGYQVCY